MAPEPRRGDDPLALIDRLFSAANAGRPFGEALAIGEHMRQTAALAEADEAPPSLVVAALLHDVAYVIGPDLTDESTIEVDHAEVGAAWIARWFSPAVSEPVRLHVEAKRYLTYVEDEYADALSEESARTLALQGGAMSGAEAHRFEADPHFDQSIRLRRWDERAKDPRMGAPAVGHFRRLLRGVLAGRGE